MGLQTEEQRTKIKKGGKEKRKQNHMTKLLKGKRNFFFVESSSEREVREAAKT